jgi:hypothetical protein
VISSREMTRRYLLEEGRKGAGIVISDIGMVTVRDGRRVQEEYLWYYGQENF